MLGALANRGDQLQIGLGVNFGAICQLGVVRLVLIGRHRDAGQLVTRLELGRNGLVLVAIAARLLLLGAVAPRTATDLLTLSLLGCHYVYSVEVTISEVESDVEG